MRRIYGLLGPLRWMFWCSLALMIFQGLWTGIILGALGSFLQLAFANLKGQAYAPIHAGALTPLIAWFEHLPVERRVMASFIVMAFTLLTGSLIKLGVFAFTSLLSAKFFYQLRRHVFTTLAAQTMTFFDTHKKGTLIQLMITETRAHFNVIRCMLTALTNLANALATLLFAVMLSWQLCLLVGMVWVLLLATNHRVGRLIHRIAKHVTAENRDQMVVVEEVLGGIKHVKLLNFFPWILKKFDEHSWECDMGDRQANLVCAFQETVSFCLGLGAMFMIAWVGLHYALLSISSLMLFIYILYRLVPLFAMLNQDFGTIMVNVPTAANVLRFLDEAPAQLERSGSAQPERLLNREIRYDHVELDYQSRPSILRGVQFTIRQGETIALVGPSGAGKTSVANMLVRLYDPTRGQILIDDNPLDSFDLGFLRAHIGIVNQDTTIFNMTVKENILIARPDASDPEVEAAARRAHAHEFIQALPATYNTIVGDRGVQLSGGQRQRLQIAQLFLKNPEVLILDEATSALDSESELFVQQALRELAQHRTSLVIAHRLSTVRHADRILVLEEGRVVEEGNWNQLMQSKNKFYDMVQRQALGLVDDLGAAEELRA